MGNDEYGSIIDELSNEISLVESQLKKDLLEKDKELGNRLTDLETKYIKNLEKTTNGEIVAKKELDFRESEYEKLKKTLEIAKNDVRMAATSLKKAPLYAKASKESELEKAKQIFIKIMDELRNTKHALKNAQYVVKSEFKNLLILEKQIQQEKKIMEKEIANEKKMLQKAAKNKIKDLEKQIKVLEKERAAFGVLNPDFLYKTRRMKSKKTPKYCGNCGERLEGDTKYCIYCGEPL